MSSSRASWVPPTLHHVVAVAGDGLGEQAAPLWVIFGDEHPQPGRAWRAPQSLEDAHLVLIASNTQTERMPRLRAAST